jgi:hypothetical protein
MPRKMLFGSVPPKKIILIVICVGVISTILYMIFGKSSTPNTGSDDESDASDTGGGASLPPGAALPPGAPTLPPAVPGSRPSGPDGPATANPYLQSQLSNTSGESTGYKIDCGSSIPIPVRMKVKGDSSTIMHWWVNLANPNGRSTPSGLTPAYDTGYTTLLPGDTLCITSYIVGGSGYRLSYQYFQSFAPNEESGERVIWISAGKPNKISFQVNGGTVNQPLPVYWDCLYVMGNLGFGPAGQGPEGYYPITDDHKKNDPNLKKFLESRT